MNGNVYAFYFKRGKTKILHFYLKIEKKIQFDDDHKPNRLFHLMSSRCTTIISVMSIEMSKRKKKKVETRSTRTLPGES